MRQLYKSERFMKQLFHAYKTSVLLVCTKQVFDSCGTLGHIWHVWEIFVLKQFKISNSFLMGIAC